MSLSPRGMKKTFLHIPSRLRGMAWHTAQPRLELMDLRPAFRIHPSRKQDLQLILRPLIIAKLFVTSLRLQMLSVGLAHTFFSGATDKARSGELINVLKEAGQPVPEALLKFGVTTKKKESKMYGAHFKEIDPSQKATKIVFDD